MRLTRGACMITMSPALVLALMASLSAMAGTLEACRVAQSKAGNVAQCVQTTRKAA